MSTSSVLNPQALKAIPTVQVPKYKRAADIRSTEDNLERKRQKFTSECIALKVVDYDNLSDSCKSGGIVDGVVDPNFSKLEPVKSVATPTNQEEPQPDWSNFKSLVLREGAFRLFNSNGDHSSDESGSE